MRMAEWLDIFAEGSAGNCLAVAPVVGYLFGRHFHESARRLVECKDVADIKSVITILYNLVEIHLIKTFQAWYPVICPDHAKTQRETTVSLSVLRLLIRLR
jgi:hypothetical protein